MRLDDTTLVLSERNLLTLLTKLYTEGSACEIGRGIDCPMSVRVEKDDVHYGDRAYAPGPMHPVTERILMAVREWTQGETIKPIAAPIIIVQRVESRESLESRLRAAVEPYEDDLRELAQDD